MAGQRQPTDLLLLKGKKHLSKSEIEARKNAEVEGFTDNITPPPYLSAKQKKRFTAMADELLKIGIIKNTDCDCLARFIIAEEMYLKVSRRLRQCDGEDIFELDKLSSIQDKFYKQCRSSANDLGLSISSRCKLVVPKTPEEKPANKFAKFDAG